MNGEFIDSVGQLWADIRRRFRAPVRTVTFYSHLLVGVVGGGGIGIWYGLFIGNLELKAISSSLLTYFPAVVAAAVIEFTSEKQPYLRSFGLIASFVFLALFLFAVGTGPAWQFVWSFIGAIAAVLFWWIAVAEKDCFRDIDQRAPVGGDVSRPLLSREDTDWKT